jgi:hypothetical protein
MNLPGHRGLLILALAAASAYCAGAGSSLALSTSAATVGGNTLTSAAWSFYLHNNPTPPVGNTTAQYNLTATTTAPTTATLYNYDTNGANRPGRGINMTATPGPTLATALAYVNWRTAAFAVSQTMDTSVIVDLWSATNTTTANRTGSLAVYVRDYNPSTSTYVEISNATLSGTYAVGRTYYRRPITVTLSSAYTLAAGHRLEIKIESPWATSQNNMLVAFDTTTYRATVTIN